MKQLYFAYGSNMCLEQMKNRCPAAKVVGKIRLEGFEFIICSKGYATILPNPNSYIEGLVWELTEACEQSLDVYEGISEGLYTKEYFQHEDFGIQEILVYIAADRTRSLKPRPGYFERIIKVGQVAEICPDYLNSLRNYFSQCDHAQPNAN